MDLGEAQEAELQELVERLDRAIPKESAHLAIPADADGNTTVGNRLGYLRFGLEFLAAALHPVPACDRAPTRIIPDIRYLLTQGSRTPFDLCEIDEAIGSRPPVASRLGAIGQLLAGVLVVTALVLCVIGAGVAWRWLFG
jgi:hypothetical protein